MIMALVAMVFAMGCNKDSDNNGETIMEGAMVEEGPYNNRLAQWLCLC